jgi:probable DNA metabolism protein
MRKNALGECHKLKGLVRFSEIGNNLYYTPIHPDNNIIEPLGQHFIRRLPTQNFIIHDKNLDTIFIYNTKTYQIIQNIDMPVFQLSDMELEYRDLWKKFFHTIAIKERTNSRLQMQYMSKKYWQDLTEMS